MSSGYDWCLESCGDLVVAKCCDCLLPTNDKYRANTELAASLAYNLTLHSTKVTIHGVVICPLQPSSSISPGCPGPESSVLVLS